MGNHSIVIKLLDDRIELPVFRAPFDLRRIQLFEILDHAHVPEPEIDLFSLTQIIQ
jgi:hypothetical protein